MKLRLLLSVLTILVFNAFNSTAQTPILGVSPQNSSLVIMDSTTLLPTSTIPMTSSTGTVNAANGLAYETCGDIYIVYQSTAGRYLGIIDPSTGVITEIGLLADNVSNITFVNGALLGVTGDGALTPETLYSIDITTAAMTLITPLGNGDDGEAIVFNPDDGLIYHWSGWGSPITMETIDPVTFTITPITITGAVVNNVGSAAYVGNGRFIISDVFDEGLKYITTTGVATSTSNTLSVFKGMVFWDGANVTNTTAANDSICLGDTAVLVCNNVGVSYEWFQDGVSTGNTTNTFNATVQGNYVCEIDNGTCIDPSDTISLTVSNIPTTNITPSPSATICNGDTLELTLNTGGGQATFQWYVDGAVIPGATNSSFFATTAGSYNATKTNVNGCSDSSAVATVLTVNNTPTVNITPSPTASICDGDTLELTLNTGGGAATFQWYLDGAMIPGATNSSFFATNAGSYNATKTNVNGCSDSSAVATVLTVNNLPTVNITPSPTASICTGDSIELMVNAGAGGGSIQWSLNGTDIIGATNSSFYASSGGSYNVTKVNMNGCSATGATPTVVTVNPAPPVEITPSPSVNFCLGDSVELSISFGGGGGSFQWYRNGTVIPGATSPDYFATMEGSYNLEKTNMNGCSDSSAVATMVIDTCLNNVSELNGLSFDIYPNPASDYVKLNFNSFSSSDVIDLQLVGLDGKIVRVFDLKESHNQGMTIDLSDVKLGMYLIRMTTSFGKVTKELIIE